MALSQTAGKGQRGKTWHAPPDVNITMSHVIDPGKWRRRPFLLSAATAIACHRFLAEFANDNIKIKWPNDLYINDRKAGGILIENIYHGAEWKWAVIGVGLNINQTDFPPELPNAISLKQVTGTHYKIPVMGRRLAAAMKTVVHALGHEDESAILQEYHRLLFRNGSEVRLRENNVVFSTVIKGVSAEGELITGNVLERRFRVGEIEWL